MESFYMYIKGNSVKDAADSINSIIDEQDYQSQIDTLSKSNEFCVSVYDGDNEAPTFSSNNGDTRCGLSDFSMKKHMSEITTLREEAKQNGGTASKLLSESTSADELMDEMQNGQWSQTKEQNPTLDFSQTPFPSQSEIQNNKDKPKAFEKERTIQTMTYVSVVTAKDGTLKTIIVNAQLSPVNATIETIQTQFVMIAGILMVVALLLALYLSRKIASPIIEINRSAKTLATGDYNVRFTARGYQEVQELNDTLNYAATELAKVENLRRELIANMSHDLRTPLTMISGYGEVMRDIPGENSAENVQIIIDETNRLTSLVNDMLDLSKLQAGVQELTIIEFNITQEVQDIISRYDKLLTDSKVNIVFEDGPDVIVDADQIKIGQVIYNFINNAINYCGEDRCVIVRQQLVDGMVMISFIDHGPGMEQDQLPYIWERYYKVDKTHVRSKIGSGLGLSIVRAVLELHQAPYGVESTLGKGTTFWFQLPIKKVLKS